MRFWDGRRRDEGGATIVDWMVAVTIGVLLSSLLLAYDVPQAVYRVARHAYLCRIPGGECPEGGGLTTVSTSPRPEPSPLPCITRSTEDMTTSSTDLLFSRRISGTRYLVRERSDGVVEIIDTKSEGKGAVVAGGAKLGKSKGKVGVSGELSAGTVEEEGDVYVLETPEEREDFDNARTERAMEAYIDPLGQIEDPYESARKDVYRKAPFLDGSYKRVSKNASVDASGGMKILRGGAGARGETGTIVEENYRTGEKTVSYDAKASMVGEVGALFVGGLSSSGDGLVTVSLTTDAEGTPTRLLFTTEAERSLAADLTIDPTKVVDLPSFIQTAAGVGTSKGGGIVVRTTAALDLRDDPAAQAEALRFVEDPSVSSGRDLLERFDDSGQGLVEVLRSSTSTDGFEAGIALLGSLGFQDETSARSLNVEAAWGWDPREGLTRRTECSR